LEKLPIKMLLCSLGWWGQNWLKNIKENKDYKLVGIVEKDFKLLNSVK